MSWIAFLRFTLGRISWRCFCVWSAVLSVMWPPAVSFNVDTDQPLIFRGKPGSYFGATAEIVMDSKKWVLVGAIKDNFTEKPDIPFPGNVYACPVDFLSETNCSVLSNLRTSETAANAEQEIYEERDQLLGATILVPEDSTKPIKICAPNWKNLRFFDPTDSVEDYYQVTGNCFLLKNRSDVVQTAEISSFRIPMDVLDFYKAPLIGFSIADMKNRVFETLYGAPNAGRSSTGGMLGKNDGSLRSVASLKMEVERSEVIKETYLTGSLFGYSIATGNLGENPTRIFYFVVGAPNFSNKNGNIGAFSVFKFGSPPRQVKQIEGIQLGSGFGQTLCLADVNGDGKDEILVSAPNWFSLAGKRNQIMFDVGIVYIYYGTGTASIIVDTPQELHGSLVPFSRFGTAIANIGDINKDGYADIAIGAPYENTEGAVYIFNGRESRILEQYSQKIQGSTMIPDLKGFGFYISRTSQDLDDNMYNDFAVGAYRSDIAVILRTRNIIDVLCEISSTPDPIPLNSSGTFCSDNRFFNPCFTVSFCFNFTGEGINNTEIDFTINVDANETRKRAEIIENKTTYQEMTVSNFIIFSNKNHCYTAEFRVPIIDRKFFQVMERPIVLQVDYKISNTTEPGKVRAILQRDITPTILGKVRFDTGCKADDGTCLSNLNLGVTWDKERILIGNDTILQMKVVLKNSGEPSFKTSITINYPTEIIFNSLTIKPSSERMQCSAGDTNPIICEIENPFYQRMTGELDIVFEISKDAFEMTSGFVSKPTLDFTVTALTNNDTYPDDNTVKSNLEVAAFSRTTLQVSGSDEQITAANRSIQFMNFYRLFNEGPCVIETVAVRFFIPVRSLDKIFIKETDVRVQNKNKKDSCKLVHYPNGPMKTTTRSPLPGSSTVRYNTSGINVIPADSPDFLPIRDTSDSSQDIFCDRTDGPYLCTIVECTLNTVKPVDTDNRTFMIPFDILLSDLPTLQKGKSFLTFVTRGQVVPTKRSRVPLVLMKNVSEEISVAILLSDAFKQDVEEVDLLIIILGSVGGLVLFLLLGLLLWKCGFFKREKRKQVDEFKRKSQYSMRKSRMASVRSARGGAGSVRSHMPEEQEKLNKKFDEMDDAHFTT